MVGANTQTLTIDVSEGLYVLRYLAGSETQLSPYAIVRNPDRGSGEVDFVTAPGFERGEMPGPGSAIVLVVKDAGMIEVTVEAMNGAANFDARFSLDLISPVKRLAGRKSVVDASLKGNSASKFSMQQRGAANSDLIDLRGHVSRRGDISANEDGWLAGPTSPSAIEGIEAHCNKPGVGLSMQVKNLSNPNRWLSWQQPGAFCGSRQQASPLVGLRLKLVGHNSAKYEIEAEALFLGSNIVTGRGNELEFGSEGGLDPLVGLKLGLIELSPDGETQPEKKKGRVKVFRSYLD